MNEILASISNREIAAAIWLAIVLLFLLTRKQLRTSLIGVAKAFFVPVIIVPLLIAAVYAAAEIYLLAHFGLWSIANLKTTVLWIVTFAFVTMFELVSAKNRKSGLAKITRDILTVATVLTFITELYSFSLLVEIVALPLVMFLVVLVEVAKTKPEHAKVAALLGGITAIVGVAYFGFSLWKSIEDWQQAASLGNALEFVIPLLLSVGFLPFLYVWRAYAAYNDMIATLAVFGLKKSLVPYARWLAITRIRNDLELLERWRKAIQQSRPTNRAELKHSLTALRALKEREASPPVVPAEHGWSPYLAMQFMSDYSFDTGHYHHTFDDEWFASSPMREIGDDVLPNNLAYYIEGTEHAANIVKFKLNVNNLMNARNAEDQFIIGCMHLLEQAISLDAVERMKLDIASLRDFEREIPYGSVALTREVFTGGIEGGYSRKFEIRRG